VGVDLLKKRWSFVYLFVGLMPSHIVIGYLEFDDIICGGLAKE
jgi:hypothetical protein